MIAYLIYIIFGVHTLSGSELEASGNLFLQELILEFLLSQHLAALLATSYKIGHDLLSRPERKVFKYFELIFCESTRYLVREASQLSEPYTLIVSEAILLDQLDGFVAGRVVVRGDEKHILAVHVFNYVLHAFVVAVVGLFNVIPDWRFNSSFLGKVSLFEHVGAPNELDAEVESKDLGCLHFHWDCMCHALEVALVAVHDNDFVALVQLMCQLLAK